MAAVQIVCTAKLPEPNHIGQRGYGNQQPKKNAYAQQTPNKQNVASDLLREPNRCQCICWPVRSTLAPIWRTLVRLYGSGHQSCVVRCCCAEMRNRNTVIHSLRVHTHTHASKCARHSGICMLESAATCSRTTIKHKPR